MKRSRFLRSLVRSEDHQMRLDVLRSKKAFIFDLDGVIYRGSHVIEGVDRCLSWLNKEQKQYRFLTNSSRSTPQDLAQKLRRLGLQAEAEMFWTSAQSTAAFIASQTPMCTAFVVGDEGLYQALEETGTISVLPELSDEVPDYVIIGEKEDYYTKELERAVQLVHRGSILVSTNQDVCDPIEDDRVSPSCGAWTALVETATSKPAYSCGKPNPLNLRNLLEREGWHSADSAMIGDRMETDVRGAIEANILSVLVLSGITKREEIAHFPFRPYLVLQNVGAIVQ